MTLNRGLPFTAQQAGDLGLTHAALRESIRSGALRKITRGVYVDGRVPDSRELRARALALIIPESATVALHTAAWLYGVNTFQPGLRHELTPFVVIPHGGHRPEGGAAVTFQTVLPDYDVREVSGVRVTSPLRTTTDLLRLVRFRPYALAAGDAMVGAGGVDPEIVRESVAQLRRLPGLKQAKELAPRLHAGSTTHGESWMKCRMLDAGLPMPALQHHEVLDGRNYWIDSAYVAQLIAIEYDGREHHLGDTNAAHDARRREELSVRRGWRWIVATKERILGDDASFEQEVGDLLGVRVLPRMW